MQQLTTKYRFGMYQNKPKRGVFFNFLLVFLLLVPAFFAATAIAATTQMKHTPPDYFVADQRIQLETKVTDDQGVKLVRCYFKAAGEADLVFVPMNAIGKNQYAGILPAPSAATNQIEYLFLAVNQANQVVRSQNFSLYQDANKKTPAWQNIPKEGEIRVSIELDQAPTQLMGFSDNVTIDVVESGARFGVVALLYHTATDSSSESAVAAANSSTGATSGGTITAGSAGWSTAAIVGVGVGVAAVAGGTAIALSNDSDDDDGDGGGGGEPEALTPTTILGRWDFEGERRDGVRRTGNITFLEGGTHNYTVRDADGQSNGSGTGTWILSGTSLAITFETISTLSGTASGNSKAFILDTTVGSNHGIYEFKK
ncbi:MAG: hypothetical protein Q7U02_11665 [Desulfosalsimonadaceae bacterium]|nr:hypothetical protein [Desulfosalsimonadaceae bacterium]